jgi:antitoxin (DNA-binding transcriptional repressor) of toxin-antitoxin stability system
LADRLITTTVGAFEAKTKLSALLDKVEQGEEVVITRRGKVVARMIAPAPGPVPARDEERYLRLKELSRKAGEIMRKEGITATSQDHDELFYDEDGLPK